MLASRAFGVSGWIKGFNEFVPEQFHAHGSDFAKLDGRVPVGVEILVPGGQSMKGVACFVENGLDIALHSHGIHEDKGQA